MLLKYVLPAIFVILAGLVFYFQPHANAENYIYYKKISKQIALNVKNGVKQSSEKKSILFPLPDKDFDPSEAAVAWKILKSVYGFDIVFASEKGDGTVFQADEVTLHGKGLSSTMNVIFDVFSLGVTEEVVALYNEMSQDESFKHPVKYSSVQVAQFDAIYLTGGHASGIKQYLESKELHQIISEFWEQKKHIAAVCHGVIALARSTQRADPSKSVLYNTRCTSLNNFQEKSAYYLTSWALGSAYRTYPETTEDEVKRAVYGTATIEEANKKHAELHKYDEGPLSFAKSNLENINKDGYFVEDAHVLTARWPGDVHLLAHRLGQKMVANN